MDTHFGPLFISYSRNIVKSPPTCGTGESNGTHFEAVKIFVSRKYVKVKPTLGSEFGTHFGAPGSEDVYKRYLFLPMSNSGKFKS